MNRGARREVVFPNDEAGLHFLSLLADLPGRFDLQVHAYALMPNHFHLALTAGTRGLGSAMKYLQGEYARWLNRTHGWDGPLWRARYTSRVVDSESYLRYLVAYLHLNPVRAHLAPSAEESRWTSHGAYSGSERPPDWLDTEAVMELYGSQEAYRVYISDVHRGIAARPEGFDPAALMRTPKRVIEPAVEAEPTLPRPSWPLSSEEAWAALRLVTGLDDEALVKRSPGRRHHPAWWLVQWWLPQATGRSVRQIGGELGVDPATLSRGAARLRRGVVDDPELARWAERLGSLLPRRN